MYVRERNMDTYGRLDARHILRPSGNCSGGAQRHVRRREDRSHNVPGSVCHLYTGRRHCSLPDAGTFVLPKALDNLRRGTVQLHVPDL